MIQQLLTKTSKFNLIALVLYISLSPVLVLAFSGGPPDGKTGAPGEGVCTDCHGSFPLNSGSGMLSIDAPEEFEANGSYEITVSLQQTGQVRWGFELTPLDIGSITVTDGTNTQVSQTGGNDYLKQTRDGTYEGNSGPVGWSFSWTAPTEPPDQVVFYAAGNASDGNGTTSGDYIYTATATSQLTQVNADLGRPEIPTLSLDAAPSPLRFGSGIDFFLPRPGTVRLTVYDGRGGIVAVLLDGYRQEGWDQVIWPDGHTSVPAGIYFMRLAHEETSITRPVVVMP